MIELLFGTAGIPVTAQQGNTSDGIKRIAEMGLGCMELEFVQRVYLDKKGAAVVAETASESKVKLSAHAPYYLNFNAHDSKKLRVSQGLLHRAASIAALCDAKSVIFHAGFYLGDPPKETYQVIKKSLAEVLAHLKEGGSDITLRPEVSGKSSQFGSIAELLNICSELEGTAPAIDFSHWHARTGNHNSYEEFARILEDIKARLGDAALKDMHIHVSGITYGEKGERRHLNLKDSDMNYTELLKALYDYSVAGLLICESPNLEEDALLLKESYNRISKSG